MATGQGEAVIDFGDYPGSNEASVVVSGISGISSTSKAEAYIMSGDATSDHTASDHMYAAGLIALSCGAPTAGQGFTIYGICFEKMQGTFKIRFVWAD